MRQFNLGSVFSLGVQQKRIPPERHADRPLIGERDIDKLVVTTRRNRADVVRLEIRSVVDLFPQLLSPPNSVGMSSGLNP